MKCKAEWCDSKPLVSGACNRHYLQVRRHGNVFITGHDKRLPIVDDGFARVPLTRGKYAIIDLSDVETVKAYQWYFDGKYASTNLPNRTKLRLHKLLTDVDDGMVVDHISMDKLDNRRANLRECKPSDNNHNRSTTNPHGLRGITWNKRKQKWAAQISIGDKNKGLGYYLTKEDAALAYDKIASELYGEHARLNYA